MDAAPKVNIPTPMPMATRDVTPILDAFITEWLREHPDVPAYAAARQAFHSAVRAGISRYLAAHVECRVLLLRLTEERETLRARREWCECERPSFVRGDAYSMGIV